MIGGFGNFSALDKLLNAQLSLYWLLELSNAVIGQRPRVVRQPIHNALLNKIVSGGSTYVMPFQFIASSSFNIQLFPVQLEMLRQHPISLGCPKRPVPPRSQNRDKGTLNFPVIWELNANLW